MTIKVKILSKVDPREWQRQLPDKSNTWGDCEFIFDPAQRQYDWLIAYEDFYGAHDGLSASGEEILACQSGRTLLVTTEPSSIKTYGAAYANQFGYVLTSQEEWALPHRNRIFSQPALRWFYGIGSKHTITLDQMRAASPDKHHTISTVCSNKQGWDKNFRQRFHFTQQLKARLQNLEVFGRGVRPIDDKAEALDDYRYHIAVENFRGLHHLTEKLPDAFLGYTLPFYDGCPNAVDYFPAESFLPIDIFDIESSCQTIERAIRDNEYEKRLPYITEARRRVLEEYNFFAVLNRLIVERHDDAALLPACNNGVLCSRKQISRDGLFRATVHLYEKARNKTLHMMKQ